MVAPVSPRKGEGGVTDNNRNLMRMRTLTSFQEVQRTPGNSRVSSLTYMKKAIATGAATNSNKARELSKANLQLIFLSLQKINSDYGGMVRQLIVDDKGLVLILVYGVMQVRICLCRYHVSCKLYMFVCYMLSIKLCSAIRVANITRSNSCFLHSIHTQTMLLELSIALCI